MKDIPANFQIQFDFLGSFYELKNGLTWGIWTTTTYIMAKNTGSFNSINSKCLPIVNKIPYHEKFQLHIQPLTSIHLHSTDLRGDLLNNTNLRNCFHLSVRFLSWFFFWQCINYMNLATARFTRRGKEAGLRKFSGATNSNLFVQFIFESFAITLSPR